MSPPITGSQILDLFAAASKKRPNALAEFIAMYPVHADDLVLYAHELNLQRADADERSITPEDALWIEAQANRLSAAAPAPADPFAGLPSDRYVEMRKALGVPSAVLEAFRDRLVNVASVPTPFLDRLTSHLKIAMSGLVAFLEERPRLAGNVAFKADAAPAAPAEKVSFAAVLAQAGVPPEETAALLEEDI